MCWFSDSMGLRMQRLRLWMGKMDYIDYRERLGIGFNDDDKQKLFIRRIHTLFLTKYKMDFYETDEIRFCYDIGIQTWLERQTDVFGNVLRVNEPEGMKKIIFYLDELKDNFIEFLFALVVFINLFPSKSEVKNSFLKTVKQALEDSHIQYELFNDSEKVFIFPKGAKELDRALVSEPLEWLSAYPNSQKAFAKALKLYADSSSDNASEVADSFRKALESFFQEFFDMSKITIEKVLEKGIYGKYLEENNIPKELRNDLSSLLNTYKNFMNNYAKHQDKTSKNVLEYIMYQTGNIVRFLISLK